MPGLVGAAKRRLYSKTAARYWGCCLQTGACAGGMFCFSNMRPCGFLCNRKVDHQSTTRHSHSKALLHLLHPSRTVLVPVCAGGHSSSEQVHDFLLTAAMPSGSSWVPIGRSLCPGVLIAVHCMCTAVVLASRQQGAQATALSGTCGSKSQAEGAIGAAATTATTRMSRAEPLRIFSKQALV